VKCSEGLSNRVSNIIRIYIDHMKFAAYMDFFYQILSYSLVSIFYHYIYGCMFCMLGPGSVFGIATAYYMDGPGIESRWGEIFRTCPDRP